MTRARKIAIVGGGPAGLSAALWLKNLGFEPWIAEARDRLGGMQNLNFLRNAWVLGHVGLTGPELAMRHGDHVASVGIRRYCGVRPKSVEGSLGEFLVELADNDGNARHEECEALLIATGTRYREAEVLYRVSGFESVPPGRIVYGPYAFADMNACAGRRILIVGGGDNAFENARLLLGTADAIHMVLRSPPRAQQALRDAIRKGEDAGICHLTVGAVISELTMRGSAIEARLKGEGGQVQIEVDRIHVLVGYEPNTGFLSDVFGKSSAEFVLDCENYLVVDSAGRTSMRGIYAAGDVCNPDFPSVVGAMAQGARAARVIELDLRTKWD